MTAEWYYAEATGAAGPFAPEEIFRRILLERGGAHFVWRETMPQWLDARDVPTFAAAFTPAMQAAPAGDLPQETPKETPKDAPKDVRRALARRARQELLSYAAVTAYLMVWFMALLFYKASVLHAVGVEFAPFGLALVKALILGKFILVLEALKIGDQDKHPAVFAVAIVKKALIFTALLVALSIGEEVVMGYAHGRSAHDSLKEVGGGSAPQALAASILMFLVLLPYLAFRRLAHVYGELPEVIFTRRLPASHGEAD
jgi:hypothetical protein